VPNDPDCLYVEGRGARSNDFIRDTSQVEFLSSDDVERLKRFVAEDSAASQDSGEIDKTIKELQRQFRDADKEEKLALNEEIEIQKAAKQKLKDDKEGGDSAIQHPFSGFEAIRPGTEMSHSMQVMNADDVELGIVLASLREFARNPYLGGHRSIDCGKVCGEWHVRTWPEDEDTWVTVGTVSFSDDGFSISDETEDKVLTNALARWSEIAKAPSSYFLCTPFGGALIIAVR
jgi:CRISPR type IV-associated protein Csf2